MNFRAFFVKNIALFYTKTTKSGSPMFRTRATTHSSIIFSFCNIKLYHNPVAMIHFMLNNLCHPAGIFPMLLLEMLIEVIDFYLLISRTWACPVERQTSLFHLIRACFLCDNRIHHRELERSACHDDDILLYADHIGRHADTMVQIRPECIEQICYNLFICFRCIHRFLCQDQRIPHNFLYHIYPFSSITHTLFCIIKSNTSYCFLYLVIFLQFSGKPIFSYSSCSDILSCFLRYLSINALSSFISSLYH